MGSVKEVSVIKPAQEGSEGEGIFSFSDRYSVFDWGEMPDHIPGKGAALCTLSAYFFEVLEKKGIKSHFRGLVDEKGIWRFSEINAPCSKMKVSLLRVIKPFYNKDSNTYDYSSYKGISENYLIPLEVIYRNTLGEGASVFKRLKNGSITYKDLGLDHEPVPGERLEKPILDVSTKLEHIDRYIKWDEAEKISSLSSEKMKKLKEMIITINNIITEETKKAGIENADGKFEFGVNAKGEIILVDVLGTPDECRFTLDGFHISKEIARRFYRKTKWAEEVEKAKKEKGDDWKTFVKEKPEPLPREMKMLIASMYQAVTNEITGKKLFNTESLASIVSALKKYDK